MDDRRYDFFISYASPDKDVARGLAFELKSRGLRTWFDEVDVHPGCNLVEAIDDAMRSSRAALILLSDSSQNRDWVSREWEAALRNSWSRADFQVVPILIGDSEEVPPFLREWRSLRVDGRHESEDVQRLLEWMSAVGPGRAHSEKVDVDTEHRFKELAAAIEAAAKQDAADC